MLKNLAKWSMLAVTLLWPAAIAGLSFITYGIQMHGTIRSGGVVIKPGEWTSTDGQIVLESVLFSGAICTAGYVFAMVFLAVLYFCVKDFPAAARKPNHRDDSGRS